MAAAAPLAPVAPDRRVTLRAYGLLLFMGLAWGLAVALMKLASDSGGHPVGLALWQVCVSGSMLLTIGILRFRPSRPRHQVVWFGLFCGAVGVAFPAIALFWAARHLPAGIVAIAFASMPLFTYLIAVTFRVERASLLRLLGVMIGLLAMALIILPQGALPAPGLAGWVLLTLAASVGMSVENVYAGAMRPPGISSVQLSCARQFGAVFLLIPVAAVSDTFLPLFAPWGAVQWAATGAGVLGGTAFTTLLYVIRTSGPTFASQTAYIITLAGIGWGMVLFGESLSFYVWAAVVLVILGSFLVRPNAIPLPEDLRRALQP
jgi:drug/metabolite transporter (DMT)-like permease